MTMTDWKGLKDISREFGFTVENVVKKAEALLVDR